MWPDRGLNQRPVDSQSDLLPTALGGPVNPEKIYRKEMRHDVCGRCPRMANSTDQTGIMLKTYIIQTLESVQPDWESA